MLKPKPTQGDTSWFVNDRFGMFIHWGLYSQPSRHEWVQSVEKIAPVVYEEKYFKHFNPTRYDPRKWARAAREAGMKYAVLTTKHHEGFCLWDSQYTDYKATNTPVGKDLLEEYVNAFRDEGLHVGFYYSLLDWHHPSFPIDIFHPLRDNPDAPKMNQDRDVRIYADYMYNQVEELLTRFNPEILWCDFSYPGRDYKGMPGKGHEDWQSERLLKMIRKVSPKIIMNNRLDLAAERADIYTPEQVQPTEWVKVNGEPVVWEACQTFSGSWGYHRDEETWKSPEQLVRMLINTVSLGGNLLMNVGPTSLGLLDSRANDALGVYREWMDLHSDSIYGCTQSEFSAPQDCRLTQKGNKLYIHVYAWPFKILKMEGLANKVEYARLLNDGSEVQMGLPEWEAEQMQVKSDTLVLWLPIKKPNVVVPVIELTLKD